MNEEVKKSKDTLNVCDDSLECSEAEFRQEHKAMNDVDDKLRRCLGGSFTMRRLVGYSYKYW